MTWTHDEGTIAYGGTVFLDANHDGTRFAGLFDGLYIVGDGWVDLGAPDGADHSMWPYGVSGDGSTVVGVLEFDNDEFPAVWTEEGGARVLDLGPDVTSEGYAYRASHDGSVILGNEEATQWSAWLYRNGEALSLRKNEALRGRDLTPDGLIAVGGERRSRWLYRFPVGYQTVPMPPPCTIGEVMATDATGGYMVGTDDRGCAYIYDRFNGTRDLTSVMEEFGVDFGDMEITGASGISADGRVICGMADYPGGSQGWVAYLPLLRCPADFNKDDQLDVFDVIGFLNAFVNRDPETDLLNDGLFNFFDVLTFLDRYSMGCL